MKKIFTTLTLVLLAIAASAQPVIKFEKPIYRFGVFLNDSIQTAVFKFTNIGDEPLVIHQAFASCGCTVPKFSKEPVAPGKKGEVVVTYNGKAQFPGEFKKPITIRSNAKNKLVRLYIQGTMQSNPQKR